MWQFINNSNLAVYDSEVPDVGDGEVIAYLKAKDGDVIVCKFGVHRTVYVANAGRLVEITSRKKVTHDNDTGGKNRQGK
jgi:cell wall-associated NlpC family hydrolase